MIEKELAIEAKHSLAILTGMIGSSSPAIPGICSKYPDVLDALLAGDLPLYKKEIGVIIVMPLKIVAEALMQYIGKDTYKNEIDEIYKDLSLDPVAAKKNMIRVCNVLIYRLRKDKGVTMTEISELK